MKVDASCHCGKITYQATIKPETAQVCHCTDCQTLSGSPWRASVQAMADQVKFTGTPKTYVKKADDGTPRAQGFCGDCGTPIYSAAVKDTPFYFLRIGPIRQRAEIPPVRQIWCRSALPWASDLSGLPSLETE